MAVDGKALAAVGVGFVFLWSGIKGWSILGTIGDLVTGVPPSGKVAHPLVTEGVGVAPSTGVTTGGIAETALQYQGHAYRFGSAPGPNAEKPWDCSSFVNYVIGVKLRAAIPGYTAGRYTGTVHGPPTGSWAVWSGLRRVSRAEVSAGDIVVWLGHMGIAISNTEMISALNPRSGTKVTPIEGHGNGPLIMTGRVTLNYGRLQ